MIIIMIIAIPTVAVVVPVVAVVVSKVAVVVAVGDLRVVHFSTHFVLVSILLLKFVAEIFQLRCLSKAKVGTKATGRGGSREAIWGWKIPCHVEVTHWKSHKCGSARLKSEDSQPTANYSKLPYGSGNRWKAYPPSEVLTPHSALAYCPWIMNRTFSECPRINPFELPVPYHTSRVALLALEVPYAMPMCPARHYEMPECREIN